MMFKRIKRLFFPRQCAVSSSKINTVLEYLEQMGKPRFTDIAIDLQRLPGLSVVLRAKNVRLTDGFVPCHGPLYVTYVLPLDLFDHTEPGKAVNVILCKRKQALLRLAAKMESYFQSTIGPGGNPQEWQTVVERGKWLQETSRQRGNFLEVTISSTLAFERKEENERARNDSRP